MQTAVTAVELVALAVWIGAANFRLWIVPAPSSPAHGSAIHRSLARLACLCGAVLIGTSAALLAMRTAVMSGQTVLAALPMAPQVLLHTHYGPIWMMRPAALVILAGAWIVARRKPGARLPWLVALGAAVLFAASRSASGHAADAGDFNVEECMDCAHLLALSTWVGGVFVAVWIVLPVLPRWVETQPGVAAEFARRLSLMSGIALAVVLLTGLYASVMRLTSFASLVNTEYGRTLSIKLLLVAATIAVGAVNRGVYVRRLRGPAGEAVAPILGAWRSSTYFARNLALEGALMVATLIAVSSMLQEMPPKIVHTEHASANGPGSRERSFALGRPAPTSNPPRTVKLELYDAKRCEPAVVRVTRDEIVGFEVTNRGTSDHVFVVGNAEERQQQEAEFLSMRDMVMPDEPNSLRLAPGQTKSIAWQFEATGTLDCVSLG